ncbi:hypothetical protein FE257_006179 [Aspergillus nanangensis]|uniref:Uncharacterized protein n=1 Tax=Aspergillus nanangensis TaxID=2582783 RepID=A0AAD4CPF4_ASPNN|nr:hypothetical protein FE257_006179 [Aspergillus nanangensis]
MSIPAATTSELHSSLSDLTLSTKSTIKDIPRPSVRTSIPKKKVPVVVDSWEDEADDDSTSSSEDLVSSQLDTIALSPSVTAEGPLDPPPTPISPQTSHPWTAAPPSYTSMGPSSSSPSSRASDSSPSRRPAKQTAVAGRMIAGALGLRAPKRTEEQRAYDRAAKEQEIKRRNRDREEAAKLNEQEERVKTAVWDE